MSIVDSAMDAIITVDESQTVVMFNRAAERTFGVLRADAFGKPLDRFIPARFRAAHGQHIRAFGRTGVTQRVMGRLSTLTGLRADGAEFPIEASISQTTAEGRRYYTVILRDVTEKRQLEAQLLHAQKMEGIGRLAGGVAHDFNNLLMAIFNYLSLASRRLEAGHPSLAALAHAQDAAERAAALTRQLLAFARKQTISPRVVSPRELVEAVAPLLRRLIGDDLALELTLSPEAWNVRVDPSQFEQVLMNLTVNARDAMPGGGTITIAVENATLDEAHCRAHEGAAPGDHVVLSVTDTGVGMSPEVLSRLFEPFFTTKPAGKGTGLGLATCHGIVRQSRGHIVVTTEPGRGTTVKVFLPSASARAEMPPGAEGPLDGDAPDADG